MHPHPPCPCPYTHTHAQNLVGSIIGCLPMLVDVIILMSFYFLMFGIMNVQLFGGALTNRCGFPVFENATTDSSTGLVEVSASTYAALCYPSTYAALCYPSTYAALCYPYVVIDACACAGSSWLHPCTTTPPTLLSAREGTAHCIMLGSEACTMSVRTAHARRCHKVQSHRSH